MNIWKLLNVGCLAAMIMLISCKGDNIIINTDNSDDYRILDGALPAIKFSYKMADALKDMDDERLSVGADSMLVFRTFEDTPISWDQLAAIDDFDENWSYLLSGIVTPVPPLSAPGNISFQEKVKFNSKDDVRYDKADFKKGNLLLSIDVPAGVEGVIVLTIPKTEPIITYTFEPDGINNSITAPFSMEGRSIEFSQGVDSSYITLVTEAHLNFSGAPSGEMNVSFKLTESKTDYLEGYFGQSESHILNHRKELGDLEELNGFEQLEIKNIIFTLHTSNHMGVPFDVKADNITFNRFVGGVEKKETLLLNDNSEIKIKIEGATSPSDPKPVSDAVQVTPENSNIALIGNPFPENIALDILSFSNIDGEIAGKKNFIGNVDSLYVTLEIEAPVWLKVKEYVRKDTIDFDFRKMMEQDRENASLIETLAMHLDFYNKLPFLVNANLFIVDEDGNKIEDLLSNFKSILDVGTLNSKGRIVEAKHTNVIIPFDKEQIIKFFDQKAMFVILETKASSYNNETEFVKVFEDAGLEVSISFEASGRIPSFN